MSGSGNRAGPEPYFTYLGGKDNGALLAESVWHPAAHLQTLCYCVDPMHRLSPEGCAVGNASNNPYCENSLQKQKLASPRVYIWQKTFQMGT